jgi:outer membrane protein OmpA-like peptidoglycan-associated protein
MRVVLTCIILLSACLVKAQTKEVLTIYFDFDKYELTERARTQIDSFLVSRGQGSPITGIELSGHCDFIGPDRYNDILSTRRVNKVKELIETYDLTRIRITTAAYGEKKPLNENRTEADRQLNRRVEIIIMREPTTVEKEQVKEETTITKQSNAKLKEQIADSATVSGSNIVLRNINFYGGMHRLLPESQPMLQELLDAMKAYPNLVIEIQGHICCQPHTGDGMDLETRVYNLSAERAKAIHDYLIASGIQQSRVSYRGFGHSQPMYPYPERSEEEREANRRVEIKIISK